MCDPTRPDKMHPAAFAIDGAETWWQSPPLSRSMKLNEVNLTIDFGQVNEFYFSCNSASRSVAVLITTAFVSALEMILGEKLEFSSLIVH